MMGFLDRLLGRTGETSEAGATGDHARHVEQSQHPGAAPNVKPDTSEASADELEQGREEPRGEEKLRADKNRDDVGTPESRRPPSPY